MDNSEKYISYSENRDRSINKNPVFIEDSFENYIENYLGNKKLRTPSNV
jgi:hypothetical protein